MRVVERGSMRVVGIEVVAGWDDLWTEMPRAWGVLRERATELGGRTSEVFVDVSVEEDGGRYRQVVGAEVEPDAAVPDGMVAVDVPAQRYLHHRHEGTLEAIAESFGRMYSWARENGHRVGSFKLDIGYTLAGDETTHDLFIRLEP